MFDQRLWKTHIRQREQQFMREAENDRMASEYHRKHSPRNTRNTHNALAVVLREAVAVMRARISAARAGTQPAYAPAPVAHEKAAAILAEAEEIIRSCCPDPSTP